MVREEFLSLPERGYWPRRASMEAGMSRSFRPLGHLASEGTRPLSPPEAAHSTLCSFTFCALYFQERSFPFESHE